MILRLVAININWVELIELSGLASRLLLFSIIYTPMPALKVISKFIHIESVKTTSI